MAMNDHVSSIVDGLTELLPDLLALKVFPGMIVSNQFSIFSISPMN
jgi:hypothetical protein